VKAGRKLNKYFHKVYIVLCQKKYQAIKRGATMGRVQGKVSYKVGSVDNGKKGNVNSLEARKKHGDAKGAQLGWKGTGLKKRGE
jgi:hypothetical protein